MSWSPFDFNLDGDVSFGEAMAGSAMASGMGYMAVQGTALAREAELRDAYEAQLAGERAANRMLTQRIEQLECLGRTSAQSLDSCLTIRRGSDIPLILGPRAHAQDYLCSEQGGKGTNMSKLQCELCGGGEFSKTDAGEFVCRGCGVIYNAEQMRSMMAPASGQGANSESFAAGSADAGVDWISELEISAQRYFNSRDFDSVLAIRKKYEAECEKRNIEEIGEPSPLIMYLSGTAKSAKPIISGDDYTTTGSCGVYLHTYFDRMRESFPGDDWFQQIAVPAAGFFELNNELTELIINRLQRILARAGSGAMRTSPECISLKAAGDSLIQHTNAIALDALQAIYVSLAKGAKLPEGASGPIREFISMLNDGLGDIPYIKLMIADIEGACMGQDASTALLAVSSKSEPSAINAEAHELWSNGNFILASQDYHIILANTQTEDLGNQPEAKFHWQLYDLMQSCLEKDNPLGVDLFVDFRIEDLSTAMDCTSFLEAGQRLDVLVNFLSHFHDGMSQIVQYLSMRANGLRHDDPTVALMVSETISHLGEISASVNARFLDIAASLLDSGLDVSSDAFAVFKASLDIASDKSDGQSTEFASLESRIKKCFFASMADDPKIADAAASRKASLMDSIKAKKDSLEDAKEELGGLGFMQINRKRTLRDSISSFEKEIKDTEERLCNVEAEVLDGLWESL